LRRLPWRPAHVEAGDGASALPLLEQASATFHRLRFRQLEGWLTILQAHVHATQGDRERAATLRARGLEVVRGIEFAPAFLEAGIVEAQLAGAAGDPAGARRALADAHALAERIGARFVAARLDLGLAELAHAAADRPGAARHVRAAHAAFEALATPAWSARAAALADAAGVPLTA
jgi:ATP/maltotriose-dependent transcriptional regulator MalT